MYQKPSVASLTGQLSGLQFLNLSFSVSSLSVVYVKGTLWYLTFFDVQLMLLELQKE